MNHVFGYGDEYGSAANRLLVQGVPQYGRP